MADVLITPFIFVEVMFFLYNFLNGVTLFCNEIFNYLILNEFPKISVCIYICAVNGW